MKQKKLDKKLSFNKSTIVDLENNEMKNVNGGVILPSEDSRTKVPHYCCPQADPSNNPC